MGLRDWEWNSLLTTHASTAALWASNYFPLDQYEWAREHMYDLLSDRPDGYGHAESIARFNNQKRRRFGERLPGEDLLGGKRRRTDAVWWGNSGRRRRRRVCFVLGT